MLELKNISYAIDGQPILSNVSLRLSGETTLAILGASGSGKSTILRIILGLASPDEGQVLINGVDINRLRYSQLVDIRKKFGMVFQDGALFDSMTVGENVGYYFMEHHHLKHHEVESQVMAMLETVGLKHTIDMMPNELSGGMRRRIAIARALIYHPELILYDEPTTGLDPISREIILNLINKLKHDHHVASIMVTHSITDAQKVANHFLIIQNGCVAWVGSKQAFTKKQHKIMENYFSADELGTCK